MKKIFLILLMFTATLGYGQTISWGAGISYGTGDPTYTPGNKQARFYYDLGDGEFWKYDGTQWVLIGAGGPFFVKDDSGNSLMINPLDSLRVKNGIESDPANDFEVGLGGSLVKNTTIQADTRSFTFNQDNQVYLQTNEFAWTLFPFFPRDSFSWRMWSLDQESNRGVVGTSEGIAATATVNGPTGLTNGIVAHPDGAMIYGDDGVYILAPKNDTSSFIVIDTAMLKNADTATFILGLRMPDSTVVKIPFTTLLASAGDGNGLFSSSNNALESEIDSLMINAAGDFGIYAQGTYPSYQKLSGGTGIDFGVTGLFGIAHRFRMTNSLTRWESTNTGSNQQSVVEITPTTIAFVGESTSTSLDARMVVTGNGADIKMQHTDAAGANTYSVKVDDTGVAINENYYFPNTDGTANQILETDGAGNLSWTDPPSGGGGSSLVLVTNDDFGGDIGGGPTGSFYEITQDADHLFVLGGDAASGSNPTHLNICINSSLTLSTGRQIRVVDGRNTNSASYTLTFRTTNSSGSNGNHVILQTTNGTNTSYACPTANFNSQANFVVTNRATLGRTVIVGKWAAQGD